MSEIDPNLLEFATERQRAILEAVIEHGSVRAASRALDLTESGSTVSKTIAAVKRRAALRGYSPDHDMKHTAPDGFVLRGTSTYYGRDGKVRGQWVKTKADEARREEIFREAVEAMAESLPREEPVAAPSATLRSSLLTAYIVSDLHLGMLAWAEETGDSYDLRRAEHLITGAIRQLVASAPASETALLTVLGDFMHYDSFDAVTPKSRNLLDSDSRYPKVVRAAIRILRVALRELLTKHRHVHFIFEAGNHDPSSAAALRECFAAFLEDEPRITVDVSAAKFHYYRFGENLIGTTHGDDAKPNQLPLIMASDRKEDWGQTTYRMWWTAHVHHGASGLFVGKDFVGASVESFRILAAQDAWASASGFRSIRDMTAIVLHAKYGPRGRFIVNPQMIDDAVAPESMNFAI